MRFWCFILWALPVASWASFESAVELRQRLELRSTPKARLSERIRLPVSRGFDQRDSQLCWVHSFLNAQETMYLIRHPGAGIELSRSYFQHRNLADRMSRLIHQAEEFFSERGTPLDALALAREHGVVLFSDYTELVPGVDGRYATVASAIRRARSVTEKEEVLSEKLAEIFEPLPQVDRRALTDEVLGSQEWTAFAPGAKEGWGLHPDSDARPGQRAYYLPLAKLVNRLREALRRGIPVTYGGNGHSILIYGADYDDSGRAQKYYIKDSYPPFFYTADPRATHAALLEVSFPGDPP